MSSALILRLDNPPSLFISAAVQVQTELAQRVSSWRTRIDPVLKEEEVRHTFDLQMYGEKILGKLQSTSDQVRGGHGCSEMSVGGYENENECNQNMSPENLLFEPVCFPVDRNV